MASAVRIALLSDVHANLPALEAVLRDVDRHGPDEVWCAGDLLGYYPWPNEVLEALRERGVRSIRGNHDRAVLGGDMSWFNELAAVAVRWTRTAVTAGSLNYLASLEDRMRVRVPEGLVVAMYHGSPRDDDEYVPPWAASESILREARADVVVLGHTHLPMAFRYRAGLLVNPGSVGQPRDGDPRAAWGLLDTRTGAFEVRRVPYDIGTVVKEVHRAGLPSELGERLALGL